MVASLRDQPLASFPCLQHRFHHLLMVASLRDGLDREREAGLGQFPPSSDGGFIAGAWAAWR